MPKQRNITFKVWLEIERFNEKTGSGQTMDAPGSSLTSFATYRQAWSYAERVTLLAETGPALLKAAQRVVSRWEKGDLAEAVRMLSDAVEKAKSA